MIKVKLWDKRYENNRSRQVTDLRWVPIPNTHDGEGFATIMAHKDAPIIFTAWILILQVASRCHPRGSLVRDDGTPMSVANLAIRTRARAEWFSKAIPLLVEIGWIEQVTDKTSPDCHPGDEEGKGMEGKRKKGREPMARPSLEDVVSFSLSLSMPASDGEAMFHKWEGSGWINGKSEIKNWKSVFRQWKASNWLPSQRAVQGTRNDQSLPPSKRY